MHLLSYTPTRQRHTIRIFVLLALTGLTTTNLSGASHIINSASDIGNLTLAPGDEIIWEDGAYADQKIDFDAMGTEENPIILRAETPGGVVFSGDSQLNIGGEYLIVEGFYWNGSLGSTGVVEFRQSGATNFAEYGKNSILRNCAMDGLVSAGDDKSRWVMLYGSGNTVENCSFLNKDSTGACVLVELVNQGEPAVPANHTIQNNYFYNFSRKDGRTNDGDSEAIRIGESEIQARDAGVLVRDNYFVETDGENEIISNKSRNNTYLNNTFRRSRGALVLRHGSGAWVEGNYFLGEEAADSGGIRISDQDHVIINNYMEGLRGSVWNSAVVWMGGNAASGGTSNGYQYVKNVLFAFNAIHDASVPIYLNDRRGGTTPENVTIANNLVRSELGELVTGDESLSASGLLFEGNLFSGSPVGLDTSGINTADPQLSRVDGLLQASSTGPAANAAVGSYADVTADLLGRTRPGSGKDIGAIEVEGSSGGMLFPPITDEEIGTFVGSSFIDKTNTCATCPDPLDTDDPGDGGDDGGGDDGGGDPDSGGTTDSGEGLPPSDDAYVSAGDDGDVNFGDADKLVVKLEGEYSKEAYLKFSLSEISDPVTTAVLRLKVRSTAESMHAVHGILEDSWNEDTITWDTRPAVGDELASLSVVADGTWMEFDVTGFVAQEAAGDGVASFALISDMANTINYHSSEASNRVNHPELLITTGTNGSDDIWRGYPVLENNNGYWLVNTGGFLGFVWVNPFDHWLYNYYLEKYIFIPEESHTASGAYVYVPKW